MDKTFCIGLSNKGRRVSVNLWSAGHGGSLDVTFSLSEKEAREMARELLQAADGLPRVATPADLGVAEFAR